MAFATIIPAEGGLSIVEDAVLDENGVWIQDISDFLLKEDASSVQIFFSDGIPNTPVAGAVGEGEILLSKTVRVFKSFSERVFRS